MRQGEILGLQWQNIDFERGTITVDKQLSRPRAKGEGYALTTPKNGKSRTMVPAPIVLDILKERRRVQLAARMKAGSMWNSEFGDIVFTNEFGKYLCFKIVLARFKKALAAAGLPDMPFHSTRHTFAVSSLIAGDDIKTLQGNLGHWSAGFTLDKYGHYTDSMKEASSRRIQEFIEGL